MAKSLDWTAEPRAIAGFVGLVFSGLIVLQSAWILALPPFAAIDEFDHVYRAAGVAEGQWRLSEAAEDARGLEVAVPPDVVDAASAHAPHSRTPATATAFRCPICRPGW